MHGQIQNFNSMSQKLCLQGQKNVVTWMVITTIVGNLAQRSAHDGSETPLWKSMLSFQPTKVFS